MQPVLYANSRSNKVYKDNGFFVRIKDRLKIRVKGKYFIKDLNIKITDIELPPNINKKAYYNNLLRAKRLCRNNDIKLAPKIYRYLDYSIYNNFQKDLMAFSIYKSTQMILRNIQKSVKNSCIVVYDASDSILFRTICFFAKEAKFIVLLSENIRKANQIREYIIANYGVTPVITLDKQFSFDNADFIIASRNLVINRDICIWHVCNNFVEGIKNNLNINDVTYKVPWNFKDGNMYFEVLGSILNQMDEKDIDKSLEYNGVFLNNIKFNDNVINFN
ncbi:hypothetical protein GTH52_12800 [Clostridium tyrobutyricum]|mgnify:CR=1 FL=1|jgi:hypothetical protein|uniref:Uncharacterized protein n=1 Tax=Clostridium tyrobutyricum DIVETGP TaxID=1408889 RepID=W6NKE3_CLOTY|nr:hypothetical protein [Clostridium tyrobutyricum]AND86166.1 hypothetical protein CTK_C29280 [Clostridium tyrobutyricum]ANP70661.1 hypothetical protein BA182_13580 [Clostridium tyrobutyricum]MBR9648268.1 hypothetical protein [Clostridium tyrobutyricum]MBV4416674.1 hypothetical protein [Clostridium tyrobutyricum]MBV4422547.1 hypothetical protein [Clostridium tyrobutyricum]